MKEIAGKMVYDPIKEIVDPTHTALLVMIYKMIMVRRAF